MLMGFAPEQLRTKGDVVLSPGAVGTSSLLPVLAGLGGLFPCLPFWHAKGQAGGIPLGSTSAPPGAVSSSGALFLNCMPFPLALHLPMLFS